MVEQMVVTMADFVFRVRIEYRDAQAFIDEDLDRVHDRLVKRLFDAAVAEFADRERVVVEVEPI